LNVHFRTISRITRGIGLETSIWVGGGGMFGGERFPFPVGVRSSVMVASQRVSSATMASTALTGGFDGFDE
jgi:hypothetical protein